MLNCQRVHTEVSFIYTPVLTCETNACEFVVWPASLLRKHLDDDFIWQQPSVWPEDSHHFHLRKRGIPQNIRLDEKMRINHGFFLNSMGIPEILRCQTQEHSKRWPLRLLAGTFTWTGPEDRSWRVDGAGKTAFPRCQISGIWNRPKFWVHHFWCICRCVLSTFKYWSTVAIIHHNPWITKNPGEVTWGWITTPYWEIFWE